MNAAYGFVTKMYPRSTETNKKGKKPLNEIFHKWILKQSQSTNNQRASSRRPRTKKPELLTPGTLAARYNFLVFTGLLAQTSTLPHSTQGHGTTPRNHNTTTRSDLTNSAAYARTATHQTDGHESFQSPNDRQNPENTGQYGRS